MKNAKRLSLSLVIGAMVACAINLSSTSLYLAADWSVITSSTGTTPASPLMATFMTTCCITPE